MTLYLSESDRVFRGICGGIAEYVGIHPAIIRVLWVIAAGSSAGIGIVLYAIASLTIPKRKV